jgi:nucleoside-diphosphate-sugar epimerase
MRVFVTGASAAIGSRLVPELVDAGHEVVGTHNSPALGAKRPRRFPTWLARLLAGEAVVLMSTEARGASNAKAKRELGWTPRYPSWREGFPAVYAAISMAGQPKLRPAVRAGQSPG